MVRYNEIINEDLNALKDLLSNALNTGKIYSEAPFIINPTTMRVDCRGDVVIHKILHGKLPVPFGKVGSSFQCRGLSITSLENAPTKVENTFMCSGNLLKTLEYAPKEIGENFYCNGNQLTSLKGAPSFVNGDFNCSENQLTTLEHGPIEVKNGFFCAHNQLTTLEYAPLKTRVLTCYDDEHLRSLKGIEFNSEIDEIDVLYTEHLPLLRLCMAKSKITVIGDEAIEHIINNHITTYPNIKERILKCQYALIKAGYKNNAKW